MGLVLAPTKACARAGTAANLWKWYLELSQVEAVFRTTKSDLRLRLIFHRECARQLLLECGQLRMLDVVSPTMSNVEPRLRVVARSDEHLRQLLTHLEISLPLAPKILSGIKACTP